MSKIGFENSDHDHGKLRAKTMEEFRRKWWNNPGRFFFFFFLLSILLSYVYVLRLGEGGDITFLSMGVLCIIGYVINPAAGLVAAVLFALVRYMFDYVVPGYFEGFVNDMTSDPGRISGIFDSVRILGYRSVRGTVMLSERKDQIQLVADLFDYFLGYSLLGLFGLVERLSFKDSHKKVFSFRTAFLVVVFLRYIESVINYLVFYPEPGDPLPMHIFEAVGYSFLYVMVEGLITFGILSIPAVLDMISFLRTMAHNDYNDRIYRDY